MGTDAHRPPHHKPSSPAPPHHADAHGAAAGPGVRPGTKSRLLEARERLKRRGAL